MQSLDREISILLGVMIGYHVVESSEDQIVVPQFQTPDNFKRTGGATAENNTGFAVVIPIERIFEAMEAEDVKKQLDSVIEKRFKQSGFRPASAKAPIPIEPVDANPSHKEDFMSVLSEAAQGPSKGD